MALMNKSLCEETKKRSKFKKIMCDMCSYYEYCIARQEDEQKYDETREMAKVTMVRIEDFANPCELY